MRKNIIIVAVSIMVITLAMLLAGNVNVTVANPPPDSWTPIPAIPPGNSRERIEIHPYPGMTVIYNPTDDDLDLPEEIRRLPLCPEVDGSPQPTQTPSLEDNEPARCRARVGGIVKFDSNFIPPSSGFLPTGNPFSSSASPRLAPGVPQPAPVPSRTPAD